MADMSIGDAMALTKNEGFLEGNGIIILILFFLIFGFNGAWGNNGNALTQAEMQAGLYNQTTDRNLSDIRNAQCTTDKEVMQNRYDNALGLAGIQKDILLGNQNMQAQMAQCCCDLKTTIHSEGEATRALITENTIQALRDEVAGYRETLSNANQTQNLLNAIGTWRANPPYPYYGPYYGTSIS